MVGIIIRKCKIKQNTGKMHEMLENASVQSSIGFGVVSDMLRRWCESSGPITEWSEAISKQWGITFDTQLNLSLKVRWPCWVVALSYLPWLLVTMLGSCFEFSSLTFGLFVLPFCLQRVVQSNHPCDCTILARFLLLKPHFSLPLNCLSTFFFSWLSHKSPFFFVLSLWWTEWGVSLVSLILLVLFFFLLLGVCTLVARANSRNYPVVVYWGFTALTDMTWRSTRLTRDESKWRLQHLLR